MKNKVSSYQKLKKENQQLRKDIFDILRGSVLSSMEVTAKWNIKFDLEKEAWMGNPIAEGKGIWAQIKGVE